MSQIKTAKPKKTGSRKKTGQKKAGSGKKKVSTRKVSRVRLEGVATYEIPTEERINATFERMKCPEYQSKSIAKPIVCGHNANAWSKLMSQKGVTRTTLLNCLFITRTTYKRALEYPSQFLTLHDLFFLPLLRA